MKSMKIASIAIGVVLVGTLLFAIPLLGNTKASDVQSTSVNTAATEEVTVGNDTDTVEEELAEENGADDIEEAGKSSDLEEADENLPGGGHEDQDSVEGQIDHQFEGVE